MFILMISLEKKSSYFCVNTNVFHFKWNVTVDMRQNAYIYFLIGPKIVVNTHTNKHTQRSNEKHDFECVKMLFEIAHSFIVGQRPKSPQILRLMMKYKSSKLIHQMKFPAHEHRYAGAKMD